MNYDDTIAALREKADVLRRAAAVLEELQSGALSIPGQAPATKRRGRKSMPPAERQQVSERMKRYWAKRRRERPAGGRQ